MKSLRNVKISCFMVLMVVFILSLGVVGASDNSTNNTLKSVDNLSDSVLVFDNGLFEDDVCDALEFSEKNLTECNESDFNDILGLDLGTDNSDDGGILTNGSVLSNLGVVSNLADDYFISDDLIGEDLGAESLNEGNYSNSSNVLSDAVGVANGSVIVIDEDSYSTYFTDDGTIVSGMIDDGDILKIANVSDKVFTIDKNVTILALSSEDVLHNSIIRLVEGSSGSVINGIRIINNKSKGSSYYLSGILIDSSSYNTITNCNINVSGQYCFAIAIKDGDYNNISDNVLYSGENVVLALTGSSNNDICNNHIESVNSTLVSFYNYARSNIKNAIGDFAYSKSKSNFNSFTNNTLTSSNGIDAYDCFGFNIIGSSNGTVISDNIISNVYGALNISSPDVLVEDNQISDIGLFGISINADNVSIISNEINITNASDSSAAIKSKGNNISIEDNIINTANSNGIEFTGSNNTIIKNTFNTESGNGIYAYYSNSLDYNIIANNSFSCLNATAVNFNPDDKQSYRNQILNNDISTDNNAIVLQGYLNRPTVCDNRINITDESKAIVLAEKYNCTPSNYSIYNNTINGAVINMTNGSWIHPDTRNIQIVVYDTNITKGDYFEIYLFDNESDPVVDANVSLSLYGLDSDLNSSSISTLIGTYNLTSDELGRVKILMNKTPENYTVVIGYDGLEDVYFAFNKSINISVLVNSIINVYNTVVTKGNYFDVYIIDEDGNPIVNRSVIFHIFDKDYIKTSDSEGKASLQINANPGVYPIDLSFSGDSNYLKNNISTEITVVNNIVSMDSLSSNNTYIVNESNYNTFFTANGNLRKAFDNSNLVFVGNFTDKRFVLSYPVKVLGANAVLTDSVVKITSDNVTVDGLKIVNKHSVTTGSSSDISKNNLRYGILLDSVKNVNITNNNIDLNSYDNAYGIYVSDSSKSLILNNTIKSKGNNFTSGIFLYQSKNNTLKNNVIKVNGTGKVHKYESSIVLDTSSSVDDFEAEGMTVPEVYKTYGIILLKSSSNDISYNTVNASSGIKKYYTAIEESTNSIVGIDLYYNSHSNKVHHNNISVNAKDPYLYGAGVLGDETSKNRTSAKNNNFSYNNIYVKGTYYAAGIIAGSNSINTTIYKNNITTIANNVTYGVIMEMADNSSISSNAIKSKANINYLVEGYHSNNNKITYNSLDAKGNFVANVVLSDSSNNSITNNKLSYYNASYLDISNLALTSHPDVIEPQNTDFYQQGKSENNTFANNTVSNPSSSSSSSGSSSGSGGSNSNTNSNSNNANQGNSTSNGSGNNSGELSSTVDGSGDDPSSSEAEGNTVGTTSSSPVTESASAYKLNQENETGSSASRTLGSINLVFLAMIVLLVLASAYKLYQRSKRNIR